MKYLRMTMWTGRDAHPMTTIIPATSLTKSIHVMANEQRQLNTAIMGPPIEVEVHELPDTVTCEQAIMDIIASRPHPLTQAERAHLTVLDWGLSLLLMLNPGGIARGTVASPMTSAELEAVLLMIAAAPEYRDQSIHMYASDRTAVSLVHGKVEIGKSPELP